jgi:hypothetical protein
LVPLVVPRAISTELAASSRSPRRNLVVACAPVSGKDRQFTDPERSTAPSLRTIILLIA